MINWKIYPIRDMSGGMKWNTSPFLTEITKLKYVVNFKADKNGVFEKSTGYERHGDAITTTSTSTSCAVFIPNWHPKWPLVDLEVPK